MHHKTTGEGVTILDTIRELKEISDDIESTVMDYRNRLKGRQTFTTQIK